MIIKLNNFLILTLIITTSSFIKAEDSIPNYLSHITANISYQGSIITNNNDLQTKIINTHIGYKFKNKLSIVINTGIHQQLDYSDKSFDEHSYFGFGIKYLLLESEKNKTNKLGIEPYVYYNIATDMTAKDNKNDFNYYDIGANFIYPKAPYFFAGTGIIQNFYTDNRSSLVTWYISFGLRF
ncbi:MAG: hypothetical protein PF517_13780 [Salinivirgaceae bacterium]|jgi:hypothetical protein|nr:hypothetical protein [Salinivirgaceae bacterium]